MRSAAITFPARRLRIGGGTMVEKLKVLVTEDDKMTQELYDSFLAKEIFERYFADKGEEALEAYRTWQPEVIILDLMLPIVSGYNVLKEIR